MKNKISSSAITSEPAASHWSEPLLVSQVAGEEGLTILMGQDLTYCTPNQICSMEEQEAPSVVSPQGSPTHTLAPLLPVNLSILASSQTIMIAAPATASIAQPQEVQVSNPDSGSVEANKTSQISVTPPNGSPEVVGLMKVELVHSISNLFLH